MQVMRCIFSFVFIFIPAVCHANPKLVKAGDGDYLVYVPHNNPEQILVVAHGTPGSRTAEGNARRYIDRWLGYARDNNLIAIAPIFDEARFGSRKQGYGGYRGLFGKYAGADDFVLDIVRNYQDNFGIFEKQILLYGHSAGGQFAARFVVQHPDVVECAVISAAGRFSYPNLSATWPYGAGDFISTISWDNVLCRELPAV